MTFEDSHLSGSQALQSPGGGSCKIGSFSLIPQWNRRQGRPERPGNIQKPPRTLRELVRLCLSEHQSRVNAAICMEQRGPVNYVLQHSSCPAGWGSFSHVHSLREGVMHFLTLQVHFTTPCVCCVPVSQTSALDYQADRL